MAEILIKAVDASHPDPSTDARACYKRGMPVVVRDDGWAWGALERLPPADGGKFVVLKITDVTVAQVENFFETRWGIDLCDEDRLDEFSVTTRRRRITVLVDSLPNNVRNTLRTTGSYTTTWNAIRSFIQDLRTGQMA